MVYRCVYVDMFLVVCINVWFNKLDLCTDLCIDACIDVCLDVCTAMSIDMCIAVWTGICIAVCDTAFNSKFRMSFVPHPADCSTGSAGFLKL